MDESKFVSKLWDGVYQGSIHATSKELLEKYGIDVILHIGFEIENWELPNREYRYGG